MDRAYNLQNPKATANSRLLSGKIFPTNELNKNHKHSNNTKDDKFHPLDNAMQELLIQLQNEQLSFTKCKPHETKDLIPQQNKSYNDKDKLMTKTSDNQKSNFKDEGLMQDLQDTEPESESWSWAASSGCGSVEKLQEKQSELQAQLDEFLQVKKKLEFKQRRILNNIYEDQKAGRSETPESVDDDDELIEFQQIENELRITDLERQLNNIQEELRIRLYKRLSSNINTPSKQQHRNQPPLNQQSNRRGSHTDESSPSSSSCSDEPTTSSTSNDTNATSDDNYKAKADHSVDYIDGQDSIITKRKSEIRSHYSSLNSTTSSQTLYSTETMVNDSSVESYERIGQYSSNSSCKITNSQKPTKIHSESNAVADNIHNYEILTPSTSKESVGCSKGSPDSASISYNNYDLSIATSKSISSSIHNTSTASSTSSSNYRNSSANSDLERIEEDEEDGQDYYNDSDRFRTIYEEKLSPILRSNSQTDSKYISQKEHLNSVPDPKYHSLSSALIDTNHSADSFRTEYRQKQNQLHIPTNQNKQITDSCHIYDEEGVESSNNSSFNEPKNFSGKLTNRPLTMYLPKPNEQIDLAEHIQALGHDLNIISNDVRLTSTSAQGYLWKSCSNNNKKWLKRYFYLDRNSKTLSYYENEAHLVKKPSSPKNFIQFDEISDVYVDHKLSGIGEKNRSSKRKNYVFVLATIGRKYQLASSRAETMRAWIDILFTAAMANDYLLAIENEACEDLEAEERWKDE